MKKVTVNKLVSSLLTAIFLLSVFPTYMWNNYSNVYADEYLKYTYGEGTYTYRVSTLGLIGAEGVMITGYEGTEKVVEPPATIDGYKVLSISEQAFYGNTYIEELIVPEYLWYISEQAFGYCTSLSKITWGASIKKIYNHAFRGCTGLTEIEIPETIDEVGQYAFYGSGIQSVTLTRDDVEVDSTAFFFGDDNHKDKIIYGNKDSEAERIAKLLAVRFESLDGTYVVDYYEQSNSYETAKANYKASIDYLNEYYLEKYPEMALEVLYGQSSDGEFFKEVAEEIVADAKDISEPVALYNWMVTNIAIPTGYDQYGFAMDVYNYRTADCMGNAMLLCQLLRSLEIPAVTAFGYCQDLINDKTKDYMLFNSNAGHAWVLAYYDNQWMLLDSGMKNIMYDEEQICKLYYTTRIDNYINVWNEKFLAIGDFHFGAYVKNGQFGWLDDGKYDVESTDGAGIWIAPESIRYEFINASQWTDYETGEAGIAEPGYSGFISSDNYHCRYQQACGALLTNSVREIDGEIYYFDGNGETCVITDLRGKYSLHKGYLVIEAGTTFDIDGKIVKGYGEDVWISADESIIAVNDDGTMTAVAGEDKYGQYCQIRNSKVGYLTVMVDDFVNELSIDEQIEINVGETVQLDVITDTESAVFNHYAWSTDDGSVAYVDYMGNVTGYNAGVTEITVEYSDGIKRLSSVCKVIVADEGKDIKTDINGEDVYITYEEGILDADTSLTVDIIEESDEAYEKIKPVDNVDFVAYDINIKDKEGNKVQPDGKVQVTLPCPEDMSAELCKVYYVSEEGIFYDMDAKYEEGNLTFETEHFSTYMITSGEIEGAVAVKTYGDANGDGIVDSKDAVLYKKYLAGFTGLDINPDVCDVNDDGTVDSKDAVRVLQYMAGMDVILGEK